MSRPGTAMRIFASSPPVIRCARRAPFSRFSSLSPSCTPSSATPLGLERVCGMVLCRAGACGARPDVAADRARGFSGVRARHGSGARPCFGFAPACRDLLDLYLDIPFHSADRAFADPQQSRLSLRDRDDRRALYRHQFLQLEHDAADDTLCRSGSGADIACRGFLIGNRAWRYTLGGTGPA